tara:strand:+ start:290 stop:451 length:162 start_codon:yes stop_codon:yes gene_type:complete
MPTTRTRGEIFIDQLNFKKDKWQPVFNIDDIDVCNPKENYSTGDLITHQHEKP